MWREWTAPYNPFNPTKVLAHREHFEKALAWLDGEGSVLPAPVMVTVDPTNLCNIECGWCKNSEFRSFSKRSIQDPVFLGIPGFLSEWGVKSVILSGGEPLLHPKIVEFLELCGGLGLQVGVKTNGLLLSNEKIRTALLKNTKWISVSIDAASDSAFTKLKKAPINAFQKTMEGVSELMKERGELKVPNVIGRFLIHHLNYGEMYAFANVAKTVGVDAVYFRPMFMPKYKYAIGVRKTAGYYLREARNEFEDENFKVYGVVSKFDRDWERIVRFKKCRYTALTGVFASDEVFYLCTERRGESVMSLGKFHPFEEFKKKWGSSEHRKMVQRIAPQFCPKCGGSGINETVEKAIVEDSMSLDFI